MPCGASTAASFTVEDGSEVEQSQTMSSLPADARPPGPVRIASTWGLPVTQMTTMSLFGGELVQVRRLLGAAAFQIFYRLPVAVCDDRQRIALFDDVLGHAVAHQPDAHEAYAIRCHFVLHVARTLCVLVRGVTGSAAPTASNFCRE